jgi:hypothetical protein
MMVVRISCTIVSLVVNCVMLTSVFVPLGDIMHSMHRL